VVTTTHIKALKISTPPIEMQQKIVDQLDVLGAETKRLAHVYEEKLAALEALKKSLHHQAFTGAL
jgi:type I restriction enzyme S subunit